jgi:four helix bundle protein
MYGLTIQVRRAAVSIVANIAEGAAKRGSKEFRRYLDMSLGSLGELSCLLRLAHDLGYVRSEAWEGLVATADEAGKCIMGLYRSLGDRRSSV